MKPKFKYFEHTHATACTLTLKDGRKAFGMAICHPEDYDFESEKTGQEIAMQDAIIQYYKTIVKPDLKQSIRALEHFYHTINQSLSYNPKSYESRMLYRQIRLKKEEFEAVNEMIADLRQKKQQYIEEKDKFYTKMRLLRAKSDNQSN